MAHYLDSTAQEMIRVADNWKPAAMGFPIEQQAEELRTVIRSLLGDKWTKYQCEVKHVKPFMRSHQEHWDVWLRKMAKGEDTIYTTNEPIWKIERDHKRWLAERDTKIEMPAMAEPRTPAEVDDAVTQAIDLEDARHQNEFLERENGRLRTENEKLREIAEVVARGSVANVTGSLFILGIDTERLIRKAKELTTPHSD